MAKQQTLASASLPDAILRKPAVSDLTGLSAATIQRLINRNLFPRPVLIGLRSVGWRASDIREWMRSRMPTPVSPADVR